MSIKKILVALLITFVVVGLIGGVSASIFDEYPAGSYGPTLMDYTSYTEYPAGSYVPTLMECTSPTISVFEDFHENDILPESYVPASIDYTSPTIASSISTSTEATATSIRSSTYLSVSNVPVTSIYESYYEANLLAPVHPPVDLSYNYIDVSGANYVQRVEVVSTPSGTVDSTIISNPSELTGELEYWNCALWASNQPPVTSILPISSDVVGHIWDSSHPVGTAEPGIFSSYTGILWP